uniref:Putative group iii salivary lipocalin n=1 Tax=Rhipicephalus pulchellus TaxID=72859 RepID=L7MBU5_RHIPC
MAIFKLLVIWVLAAAPREINCLFHLPGGVNLSRYHEPWRLVTILTDVYLSRVSKGSWMNEGGVCVRSRYLRAIREERTALRTLDLYLGKDRSANWTLGKLQINGTLSMNISLNATSNDVLYVNITSELAEFLLSLPGVDSNDLCIGQYAFSVLFGDNRCLLLETRKSVYTGTSASSTRRSCSLWTAERDLEEPLQCCVYMFNILCGKSVEVSGKSCG